ncbi:unnamed protein product [Calypogeia fissa]
MATIQASLVAPSRLSSLASLSANSVSTTTNVQCKAWNVQQKRRSLSIRATTSGRPAPPSSPSGLGGSEAPLGANASTAPVPQKGVPKGERIAYVCSACGYIYDLDTPFEEQPNEYECPVCSAPKESFDPQNATLGQGVFDLTKGEDASSTDGN